MEKMISSPLSGNVVPLEQVPDSVFADKILGDGCAVIPNDGKIYSPVNGEISSVAETLHAYGFTSEDGLEVLVHFGLETVALGGEGFTAYVKAGDKVKVGDLVAEVDMELLRSKNINLITPVLVCDGADELTMSVQEGEVKAGEKVLTLSDEKAVEVEVIEDVTVGETSGKGEKPKKKRKGLNFDFLQKLGKVLMVVIAVMPAAGLMISLGKLVAMAGGDLSAIVTIGGVMENIGWAIINNLHVLFAVAIGGSWAKERAGGAFAALISFILINNITGAIFGVTNDMLNTSGAVVNSLFGKEMLVETILPLYLVRQR